MPAVPSGCAGRRVRHGQQGEAPGYHTRPIACPAPPVTRLVRIDIAKEAMNFSAAHFTIFSATERENLHGHNFRLGCAVTAPVGDDGLCFDYAIIKRKLKALCDTLDERMLLPAHSPHLRVDQDDAEVRAHYAGELLRFLPRDVIVLPVANITVEALSGYFLALMLDDPQFAGLPIHALEVRVSSGSGQWGISEWTRG